jgi:hypothetical protein
MHLVQSVRDYLASISTLKMDLTGANTLSNTHATDGMRRVSTGGFARYCTLKPQPTPPSPPHRSQCAHPPACVCVCVLASLAWNERAVTRFFRRPVRDLSRHSPHPLSVTVRALPAAQLRACVTWQRQPWRVRHRYVERRVERAAILGARGARGRRARL